MEQAFYSIAGVRIYESFIPSDSTTINLSRFPKGIYIVTFGGERWKEVIKVVMSLIL
jgi:hypothetical protein